MARTALRRLVLGGPWFLLLGGVLFLTALPVDLAVQAAFSVVALLLLAILRRRRKQRFGRIFSLIVMLMISLRYMFWRTSFTLVYADFLSFIGTILLYGAEVYGFLLFLLGSVVNLSPVNRASAPVAWDDAALPSVDVLVPSYNENSELLAITLVAATQIRYPKDQLTVYLLDDGGTVEKRSDPDPVKAAAAQARHVELQSLCRRFGVCYLTRERNRHAKAGNMNEALPRVHGHLVLVLDADHVPAADILEKTVGFFQRDPKLFLVQTPHFFINADPVEKNLNTFAFMPGESEMFHRVIQKGLDFWNASFFCGSAALLRRSCLDELGGFAHQSITEDAETALLLHARGYHSAYVGQPMVAGLAPESFSGFVTQRMRWAQGMVQIFMLRNPLFIGGLTVWQRLGYLSNCLFWFFPFARVIYLLAPTAYLFFGLKIYHASAAQFLAYTLPYFIASMYATGVLFGNVRWPFISFVYEVMQSPFSLNAVWQAIRNPRAPNFQVTPKGGQIGRDYISPLAGPFYRIFLVLTMAMAVGFYRIRFGNPQEMDVAIVTMLWNLFNYLIILAVLGALYERRQRHRTHWMPANLAASLTLADGTVRPGRVVGLSLGVLVLTADQTANLVRPGRVVGLSLGGARFVPQRGSSPIPTEGTLSLAIENRSLGRFSRIEVGPRRRGRADRSLGLAFEIGDDRAFAELISLVYGDSERWRKFWDSRLKPVGMVRSLVILVLRGMLNFGRYLTQVAAGAGRDAGFLCRHIDVLPGRMAGTGIRLGHIWTRCLTQLRRACEAAYIVESHSTKAQRKPA